MKAALTIAMILILPAVGFSATTWYVDWTNVSGPWDGSFDHPFTEIQDGINAASDTDRVVVMAGTYMENLDFEGKAITVQSNVGPAYTIIDGGNPQDINFGSAVIFQNSESRNSTLTGFTITNGSGTYASNLYQGGGVYCDGASPSLVDNIIIQNFADHGGGIGCDDGADPLIQDNIITENEGDLGGGINCFGSETGPHILRNIISDNFSDYGGGVWCWSAVPILEGNSITGNLSIIGGGGIATFFTSPLITGNTVMNNWATDGGGIWCEDGSPIFTNNVVAQNTADNDGGGIACYNATPSMTNNTIADNSATNNGGGIWCLFSTATIVNVNLWDNQAAQGPAAWLGGIPWPSTLDVSYSVLEGGQPSVFVSPGSTLNWGSNVFNMNPKFADTATGDYHILFTSPCKDNGNGAAQNLPTQDIDGNDRLEYSEVDIGADEFAMHLYVTGDAEPGGFIVLSLIGEPESSPVGFWLALNILDNPVPGVLGDWYLVPPLMGPFVLAPLPEPDGLEALPATLPPAPAGPYTIYLQGLVGDRLTDVCTLKVF